MKTINKQMGRTLQLTGLLLLLLLGSVQLASASILPTFPEGTVLTVGFYHNCGIKDDGSVDCWGDDYYGQAADQIGSFAQIAAGGGHTCGLKADGSVDCWGNNSSGEAADQIGPFTQIAAGYIHTCGLKADGTVSCWGYNGDGRAGNQTGPFTQISANYDHTCGLKADGSVNCWGSNTYGQTTSQTGPFTQISAGQQYNCGLKTDGSVDCWGRNVSAAIDQAGPFTQIAAGGFHTCGLKADGSVNCWGNNSYGQAASQTGPFTQISIGRYHSCGFKTNRSIDCWGDNTTGGATDQVGPFGNPLPPVPDAGGPYAVAEGSSTSLDASATTDPDQDPATLTYEWDFDGDNSYDDATGISPSFSAATLDGPSSVTVGLKVTNNAGGSATTTATVNVTNVNPTISSVSNSGPVDEGSNATITITATDVAGAADPLSYEFDCDSDGSYEVGPQASNSTNCATGGSNTEVTVRVTDGDGGQATDSTTVSVNNLDPTISSVSNNGPVAEGSNATITVNASDADRLSYEFDCDNDGDYEVGPQASSSTTCPMGNNGSAQVNVRVSDGEGGEATDSTTVTVNGANPSISEVSNNGPIDEGNSVTITVTASDVDTLSYEFDCDDDGSYEVGPQASNSTSCFFTDQTSSSGCVAAPTHAEGTGTSSGLSCAAPNQSEAALYGASGSTDLSGWVNIRVTDDDGGEATTATFVEVNNADPTISSVSNDGPVDEFSSVTITVNATDPAGDADTLSYEFDCDGDGSYEIGPQAENVQECAVGDDGPPLQANVRVSDEDGGEATSYTMVETVNIDPTISSVTNNGPVNEGSSVTITVSASDVGEYYDPLSYEFDCDNDGDYEVGPQASNSTNCTAGGSDTQVNVRVTDDDGGEATDSTTVAVNNLDPVISGVSNAGPVNEGGSVTVSVTASDADNLRYEFDCDGDGEYEVGPQTSSSTNCAVGGSNTQINVRVTDGEGGEATDSTTVTVNNLNPVISSVSNNGPVVAGDNATITVYATDADSLSYEFDCDDNGRYEIGPQSSNSTMCSFATIGEHLVNVRVTDGDGGEATDQTIVVVFNYPATCDITAEYVNVIYGTERNDKLVGTPDNDIIFGLGGNDRIAGMGGNDCLIGGPGNDQLFGDEGSDILWGGEVDNSTIYDSRDRDKLYGNDGNDELHGGGDKDRLDGNDGDDTMYGDDGDDTMVGHDGDDTMYGGAGRDNMRGDDGNDRMYGEAGDDRLYGRQGDDILDGGADTDQLDGSAGMDTCTTGEKLKSCELDGENA